MARRRAVVAAALVLAGFGGMVGAPVASAGGADGVINDLQAKGYTVQINWINGYDTKPLSYCTVTGVNNPDRSGAPPKAGDTVYVDVRCPNHEYGDGGSFGVGVFG